MAVLLVRHAKAGDPEEWDAPDDVRPLTARGEAQAEALVTNLAGFDVVRVLSSPYLRCSQTVAPLAAAYGLTVEPSDDLAEGAGRAGAELVGRVLTADGDTVLCTHGDVLEDVLDSLGITRDGYARKGATWVLDGRTARHIPAP
jgi:phosphohistidine phosphatase SixA